MKNEICVAADALGVGGGNTSPQPSPQNGEGAGMGGEMVTPEVGDVVDFSGKGRVTRLDNGAVYFEATEINGQPVMGGEGEEDEGAALDREMEGLAGGGGGGSFSTALGLILLLLSLMAGTALAKDDVAWAGARACSGTQVSNYVAFAAPTQGFSVEIDNQTGATLYLLVFDSSTNSLNGRVPHFTAVPIPTGSVGFKDWNTAGAPFYYGVNVCLSTTPYSLTNASSGGAATLIHSGGAR